MASSGGQPSGRDNAQRLVDLFHYLPASTKEALEIDIAYASIDTPDYNPAEAKLSADPVITALAQLATLRTGTERAFVSLIDDQQQIIVAEATSSISFIDKDEHEPGESLCIGAAMLDLKAGICASTMIAFIGDYSHWPYVDDGNKFADRTRYWIGDLSKTSQFQTRPYVVGFPYMRFYAEVPITSPSGFVIGTLAVVGPTARSSLCEKHHRALVEIASTIMRHLEHLRSEKSHQSTAKRLSGLEQFVYLGEAAADWKRPPLVSPSKERRLELTHRVMSRSLSDGSDTVDSTPRPSKRLRQCDAAVQDRPQESDFQISIPAGFKDISACEGGSAFITGTSTGPVQASTTQRSGVGNLLSQTQGPEGVEDRDTKSSCRVDASASEIATPVADVPRSLEGVLSTACDSLLASMDLDLVVFAGPGTSRSREWPKFDQAKLSDPANESAARTIAAKTSNRLTGSVEALPSKVLAELHRLHPDGCRLNFMLDDSSSDNALILLSADLKDSGNKHIIWDPSITVAILQSYPGIQSALFLPFWSESRQSWVASAFAGSMAARRVLDDEDLYYFSLFRSCVLTCVTNMDLVSHDKAKLDFFSSISHELRSPIHGILGNVELASDSNLDAAQMDLIQAIEQCSRTLLDTVDHILDYAKIRASGVFSISGVDASVGKQNLQSIGNKSIRLDTIVEETVVAAITGYRHMWKTSPALDELNMSGYGLAVHDNSISQGVAAGQEKLVAVCLDTIGIRGWKGESHVNTWRRIILNLVGNSLKYTTNGIITISLSISDGRSNGGLQPSSSREAVLSVRDTGSGMGSGFVQNHLFRPFQQENGLLPGTGLGMSIVQKLVQDLGGSINVESELGVGSEFIVTMPLKAVVPDEAPTRRLATINKLRFFGFDDPEQTPMGNGDSANSKRVRTMKQMVKDCFITIYGIQELETEAEDTAGSHTIIVCTNSWYKSHSGYPKGMTGGEQALTLVISDDIANQYASAKEHTALVEYVAQPISCLRVTTAVDRLISAAKQKKETLTSTHMGGIPTKTNGVMSKAEMGFHNRERAEQKQIDSLNIPAAIASPESAKRSVPSVKPGFEGVFEDKRPKLLLVDDNVVNINLLKRQVAKLGYEYMTASDGAKAVAIFQAAPLAFPCIFMDLSMPVMDGFEASRKIREIERNESRSPTSVIIALTGLSDANAQEKAMQSGVDMFMTKPMPLKSIKELVQSNFMDCACGAASIKA